MQENAQNQLGMYYMEYENNNSGAGAHQQNAAAVAAEGGAMQNYDGAAMEGAAPHQG